MRNNYDAMTLLFALLITCVLAGGLLCCLFWFALQAYQWIGSGPKERAFWRCPDGKVIRVELPVVRESSPLRKLLALTFAAGVLVLLVLLVLNFGAVLDALSYLVQLVYSPYAS